MKRKVDKTKKSNIKCEHCRFFDDEADVCSLKEEKKHYWNRCKCFEWEKED